MRILVTSTALALEVKILIMPLAVCDRGGLEELAH